MNVPTYNPDMHHRRSIRLKGYDYSQEGLYFITLCTQDRQCLFGDIATGEMNMNEAGKYAQQCWLEIPQHFPQIELHEYVIMPNHIHGIIEITVGANCFSPIDGINTDHVLNAKNDLPIDPMNVEMDNIPQNDGMNADPIMRAKNISPLRWQRGTSQTLGSVIRGFKIGVTKWFRNETDVYDVWQRNYYEHIIRNQQSYDTITNYILTNVEKWPNDKFFIQ